MRLLLDRTQYEKDATVGEIYVDGVFECFSLEDQVRAGEKVRGQTAIPTGTYEVMITMSPRFKRRLPLLVNVPGFDGIRIHPGNTHEDTEGCLLVGERVIRHEGMPFLTRSRAAFDLLFAKLDSVSLTERITIEVME